MRKPWAIVLGLAVVAATAQVHAQLSARVVVSGLSVPMAFVQDPLDRATQCVVQQDGHIRAIRNGTLVSADFLDDERSLLRQLHESARSHGRRTVEPSGPGSIGNVSSFGTDADGELHVVGYSSGRILKILGPPVAPQPPSGLRLIR